jgi:hypothetical protein
MTVQKPGNINSGEELRARLSGARRVSQHLYLSSMHIQETAQHNL